MKTGPELCKERFECHKVKKGLTNILHGSLDFHDAAECFLNLLNLRL